MEYYILIFRVAYLKMKKEEILKLVKDVKGDIEAKFACELQKRDSELEELKASMQSIKSENDSLKTSMQSLKSEIGKLKSYNLLGEINREILLRKIDQNEQYTRKQNLIIDGLQLYKQDSDDHIRDLVIEEIARLKLDIKPFHVVRAHCTGYTPVICRFSDWRCRNTFYEARKSSYFYLKADLTRMNQELLDYAQENVNTQESKANELVSFVYADRNCRIGLKCKDDRFKKFNSKSEFDTLIDWIENTTPAVSDVYRSIEESLNQRQTGTSLVDLHDHDIDEWVKEESHVYIGRTHGNVQESFWANPFKVEEHGRDKALEMYSTKVKNSPQMMARLPELLGASLGCWCPWPLNCHGQFLINLLSQLP